MSFGGKFWEVSRDDFIVEAQGGTDEVECVGAFFEIPEGSDTLSWVVGDASLKNMYSVFGLRPPNVGFTALSSLPRGSRTAADYRTLIGQRQRRLAGAGNRFGVGVIGSSGNMLFMLKAGQGIYGFFVLQMCTVSTQGHL